VGKIAWHHGSIEQTTVRDFAHAVELRKVRTAWATRPRLRSAMARHVGPRLPPYGAYQSPRTGPNTSTNALRSAMSTSAMLTT